MGECQSKTDIQEMLKLNIGNAIENDNSQLLNLKLKKLFKLFPDMSINSPFIQSNSCNFTPLSYSISKNSEKCCKLLVTTFKANIRDMEINMSELGISVIHSICESGNLPILKLYLPEYLKNTNQQINRSRNPTSSYSSSNIHLTPIQLAVTKGYVNIIQYLAENPDTKSHPSFSLSYVNPQTGENSALVSVSSSSFTMVKLLYEKYDLDFTLINSFDENVYMILAKAAKENFCYTQQEILMYLIGIVHVPVMHNYDLVINILSELEVTSMLTYFEQRVREEVKDYPRRTISEVSFNANSFINSKQDTLVSSRGSDMRDII